MAWDVGAMGEELRRGARRVGWLLGLRGLLTVLFGILALARPGFGVAMLVAIFGFYALADGLTAAVAGFRGAHGGLGRGLLFLEAIIGIAAGIIAFARPGAAAIAVLIVIAVRAIAHGVLQAGEAIAAGEELPNRWLLALGGIASIVFGILLLSIPSAGLLALAWLVGVYALVVGTMQIAAAFWVRTTVRRIAPTQPAA